MGLFCRGMNLPQTCREVHIDELPHSTLTQDDFLKEVEKDPKALIRFPDSKAGFGTDDPRGLKILGLPLFRSVKLIKSPGVEIAPDKEANLYGILNVTWQQITDYLQSNLSYVPGDLLG